LRRIYNPEHLAIVETIVRITVFRTGLDIADASKYFDRPIVCAVVIRVAHHRGRRVTRRFDRVVPSRRRLEHAVITGANDKAARLDFLAYIDDLLVVAPGFGIDTAVAAVIYRWVAAQSNDSI
jgi:hypothetical protein